MYFLYISIYVFRLFFLTKILKNFLKIKIIYLIVLLGKKCFSKIHLRFLIYMFSLLYSSKFGPACDLVNQISIT